MLLNQSDAIVKSTNRYHVNRKINDRNIVLISKRALAKGSRSDAEYVYGNERLERDRYTKVTGYYNYDGRGNVTSSITNQGRITSSYRYTSYGELSYGQNHTYENIYTFNAENYHPMTNTQYLRARVYSVTTGRFLTQDTYLGDITNSLTANRYIYCIDNPLNYKDPSGYKTKETTLYNVIYDNPSGNRGAQTKYSENQKIHAERELLKIYSEKAFFTTSETISSCNASNYLVTKDNLDDFGFYMGDTDYEVANNLFDLNRVLYKYGIATDREISLFMGFVNAESWYGSRTIEKAGKNTDANEEAFRDYFNNEYGKPTNDLGNETDNGDGAKFRGAGYLQITGRYNYDQFSKFIGDSSIVDKGYVAVGGTYNEELISIKSSDNGVIDVSPYAWEVSGWLWTREHEGGVTLNDLANSISIDNATESNREFREMMRLHVGPEYTETDLENRLNYSKDFYNIIN